MSVQLASRIYGLSAATVLHLLAVCMRGESRLHDTQQFGCPVCTTQFGTAITLLLLPLLQVLAAAVCCV